MEQHLKTGDENRRNEHKDKDYQNIPDAQPQGREGNPNQHMVNRDKLNTDEKELDRRPADALTNADDDGNPEASAIAGIQDDQHNVNGETMPPNNGMDDTEFNQSKEDDGNENSNQT